MSAQTVETLKDPEFHNIVAKLKAEFLPQKMFLFGSRASVNFRENSDYDFVIVVDKTEKTRIENLIRASELFAKTNISVDVFVYPVDEFNDWKEEFNSIPELALNTGIEVDLASF